MGEIRFFGSISCRKQDSLSPQYARRYRFSCVTREYRTALKQILIPFMQRRWKHLRCSDPRCAPPSPCRGIKKLTGCAWTGACTICSLLFCYRRLISGLPTKRRVNALRFYPRPCADRYPKQSLPCFACRIDIVTAVPESSIPNFPDCSSLIRLSSLSHTRRTTIRPSPADFPTICG